MRRTIRTRRGRDVSGRELPRWSPGGVLLVLSFLLSACASRGLSIESAVPDRASITGSVGAAQRDDAEASDAGTIRSAVSAVDMGKLGPDGMAWSNPVTGNSGVIYDVAEKREGGGLCRVFRASRVTFDGVTVFHGKACLSRFGVWSLAAFDAA